MTEGVQPRTEASSGGAGGTPQVVAQGGDAEKSPLRKAWDQIRESVEETFFDGAEDGGSSKPSEKPSDSSRPRAEPEGEGRPPAQSGSDKADRPRPDWASPTTPGERIEAYKEIDPTQEYWPSQLQPTSFYDSDWEQLKPDQLDAASGAYIGKRDPRAGALSRPFIQLPKRVATELEVKDYGVKVGDEVKAGQPIYGYNDYDAEAEVAVLRNEVKLAPRRIDSALREARFVISNEISDLNTDIDGLRREVSDLRSQNAATPIGSLDARIAEQEAIVANNQADADAFTTLLPSGSVSEVKTREVQNRLKASQQVLIALKAERSSVMDQQGNRSERIEELTSRIGELEERREDLQVAADADSSLNGLNPDEVVDLVEAGGSWPAVLVDAVNEYKNNKSELAEGEKYLESLIIRSPIDGIASVALRSGLEQSNSFTGTWGDPFVEDRVVSDPSDARAPESFGNALTIDGVTPAVVPRDDDTDVVASIGGLNPTQAARFEAATDGQKGERVAGETAGGRPITGEVIEKVFHDRTGYKVIFGDLRYEDTGERVPAAEREPILIGDTLARTDERSVTSSETVTFGEVSPPIESALALRHAQQSASVEVPVYSETPEGETELVGVLDVAMALESNGRSVRFLGEKDGADGPPDTVSAILRTVDGTTTSVPVKIEEPEKPAIGSTRHGTPLEESGRRLRLSFDVTPENTTLSDGNSWTLGGGVSGKPGGVGLGGDGSRTGSGSEDRLPQATQVQTRIDIAPSGSIGDEPGPDGTREGEIAVISTASAIVIPWEAPSRDRVDRSSRPERPEPTTP